MTKKVVYPYEQIVQFLHNIVRDIHLDDYRPDYIVGITRGGLMPAAYLSNYLKVPMKTIKVAFRDNIAQESNPKMALDAFEYKKILVVDDINDSGATLAWIKKDWQSYNNSDPKHWDNIWNNTVKFAVLIDNQASDFTVDYAGHEINKDENPEWCVFPWEKWWSI